MPDPMVGWYRQPTLILASGFGTGYAPVVPGTVGTLVAIPLWWLCSGLAPVIYGLISLAGFMLGVWVCSRAMSITGEHDNPEIVIDEVVGYFVALAFVPIDTVWVIVSFFVFRVFDVFKPWPINWLDRNVSGGFGVMLDDLVAGVFTAVVVMLLVQIW